MLVFARFLAGSAPSPPVVLSPRVRTMIRQALPFGLLMLGYALYYRVDMIMLHWLREPRDVGLYAAAYRFLDAVILLAASIGGPFYPRLSSMVGRDLPGIRNLLEGTWKPLLALGLPLLIGTFFLADSLTQVLFGDEFVEAGVVLKVLILGSLPLLWITIPNQALLAADVVLPLARVYGLSVAVNILLNIVLIPRWGPVGAAVATVACEWLNLALVVGMARREFGLSLSYEGLWRYLVAAAAMVVVLWASRDLALALEVVFGTLAYVAGLFFVGYLRSADLLTVKRLLAQ
jgi:O-antigen/teichoic acid export membrane protein